MCSHSLDGMIGVLMLYSHRDSEVVLQATPLRSYISTAAVRCWLARRKVKRLRNEKERRQIVRKKQMTISEQFDSLQTFKS